MFQAMKKRCPACSPVIPKLLEVLFDRYSRLVLSIARGIVRDAGEAEDVVQEVFFYLYKKVRAL